jgi:hypothetical protein
MQNKYFQVLREMLSHKKTWFKLVDSFYNSSVSRETIVSSNGFWFRKTSPRAGRFFHDTLSASSEWKATGRVKWEGTAEDFVHQYGKSGRHQSFIKKIKEVDGKEWEGFPDSLRKEIAK